MDNIKSVVEALLFSAGTPLLKKEIVEKLPEVTPSRLTAVVKELQKKYSGDSGVLLLEFNGKLQFSSNPAYGDAIAEILTPLRERQLSKTLLEVLSTIAYRQPITRLELEEMRGKSDGTTTSCEYAIAGLMKAGLIEVVGRKEAVGRPFLYGTTDEFLKKFGLTSLDDLPDATEVLEKLKEIYAPARETLFGQRDLYDEDGNLIEQAAADEEGESDFDEEFEEEEIPDFLAGEKIEVFD